MSSTAQPRTPFGPTASGGQALGPFCPTVVYQAELLDHARCSGHDLTAALPLPLGMRLAENPHSGQIQLIFDDPTYCDRSRRVFGYVGEISTKASRGTALVFPPRYFFAPSPAGLLRAFFSHDHPCWFWGRKPFFYWCTSPDRRTGAVPLRPIVDREHA